MRCCTIAVCCTAANPISANARLSTSTRLPRGTLPNRFRGHSELLGRGRSGQDRLEGVDGSRAGEFREHCRPGRAPERSSVFFVLHPKLSARTGYLCRRRASSALRQAGSECFLVQSPRRRIPSWQYLTLGLRTIRPFPPGAVRAGLVECRERDAAFHRRYSARAAVLE